MNLKPNPEDNGVITKEFLKKLCKKDFKNYYSTPYLNDILYLHYKGFNTLANLEQYTGLKCVYFEGNAIRKIEGLDTLINLRCLYLQENMICKIQGLQNLVELSNLNLSENLIQKVEGLGNLRKLSNLQLKNNRIGTQGFSDVIGLLQAPSISALDISNNKIATDQFLPEILMKMPNIAVVYLQNNDFTKNISHYRKTLISKIPALKYIDDKPVFEDEKRFSEAWARGGLEQERKQRVLYKRQKEQQQLRQHNQFRSMISRHRGQKEKVIVQSSQSDSENVSKEESLQTYKSPVDSHDNSQKTSSKQSEASDKEASEKEASEKALSEKDLSQKALSEKPVSEKDLSQKDLSEKALSEHDKQQLPRLQQLPSQPITFKAQQKNKAIYLDQLD